MSFFFNQEKKKLKINHIYFQFTIKMPGPKKKKGGKRKKRGKKNVEPVKQKLHFKTENSLEMYARVTKMLGDCRIKTMCDDGKIRISHIPGKFRKRVWINENDIVIVTCRKFEMDKADVIYKYNNDEVHKLKRHKTFPRSIIDSDDKGGVDDDENNNGDMAGINFQNVYDNVKEHNNRNDRVKNVDNNNGKLVWDDTIIDEDVFDTVSLNANEKNVNLEFSNKNDEKTDLQKVLEDL